MDLRERLSDRIHIEDIHEILRYVQGSQKRKSELYGLISIRTRPSVIKRYGPVAIFPQMRINGYTINKMN